MEKKLDFYDELVSSATDYLKWLDRKKRVIEMCQSTWMHFRTYLLEENIDCLTRQICDDYIYHLFAGNNGKPKNKYQKHKAHQVYSLLTFQNEGRMSYNRESQPDIDAPSNVAEYLTSFLREAELLGNSQNTLYFKRRAVVKLGTFLNSINATVENITPILLINFINSLPADTQVSNSIVFRYTKQFMKWLHENSVLKTDMGKFLKQLKHSFKGQSNERLDYYTREEIEKILASIDRKTDIGKRNYAILLIIARLGLRAGDVCSLRFGNISWETNTISLIQEKTKQKLTLPISINIGQAIIDYITLARPQSDSPYIFLRASGPYLGLGRDAIYDIVRATILKAGADIKGRSVGAHIIRRSLASNMINTRESSLIVKETLGHSTIESTNVYMRISVSRLLECTLPVPLFNL
jgi:integrase/recombinase XerD